MRVVFVDFDGVLNSDRYFAAREREGRPVTEWWGQECLDPNAVARLDTIAARAGACVVVSSSWRLRFSLDELRAMLVSNGLRAPVVGRTPALYRTPDGARLHRGDEIQRWIDEAADVRSFAILEDEDELGALEAFAVRTRSDEGLLDAHVDAAIALLDRGH